MIDGLNKDYRKATVVAASLQIPITVMFASIFDGEQLLQFWLVAVAAFWTGYAIIRLRRARNPTRLDLFFIRWGTVPLMILAPVIMIWVWKLRCLN